MGWMELLVVGAVALIVVGPKDLPVMFQTLGRITAKIKRMAREFQSAMSDAAKASGTSDISKELMGLTSPKSLGLDGLKGAADSFERWDPMSSTRSETGSNKKAGTSKITEERAKQAEKIREKTAQTAQERLDREADKKPADEGKVSTATTVEDEATATSGAASGSKGRSEPAPSRAATTAATPSIAPSKPTQHKKAKAESVKAGESRPDKKQSVGAASVDSNDEGRG